MTSVTPTPSIHVQKPVQVRPESATEQVMTENLVSEASKSRVQISGPQGEPTPSLQQLMGKAMDILTMMQADRAASGDVIEPAFESAEAPGEMNELFEALGIRSDERVTRADLEAARQDLPPLGDSAAEVLRLLRSNDGDQA